MFFDKIWSVFIKINKSKISLGSFRNKSDFRQGFLYPKSNIPKCFGLDDLV